MPVKFKRLYKGDTWPVGSGGHYISGTIEETEARCRANFSIYTKAALIASGFKTPKPAADDAWMAYWEDEPDTNEWGEVAP